MKTSGIRSVRYKLLLVVLATTFSALLVASAAMVFYDLRSYRQGLLDDLTTQADILGRSSVPALAFEDAQAASETLALLKAKPNIANAVIYTAKGSVFASYLSDPADRKSIPRFPESDGHRIDQGQLVVFKRIVEHDEILGTVYLSARYEVRQRMFGYLGILGGVMLGSLLVALLMSAWLQATVTKPILAITRLARQIIERRDFSLRAEKTTDDEIGFLVDAFNGMLTELGQRTEILEASNQKLAHEIAERRGAEEALHIGERRNRALITAISAVVWSADGKGRFTEEQPSWAAYTGQARDQYPGLGWRKAFHADDQNTLDLAWARAIYTPEAFELELRLWHQVSGRYRYVSLRAVPLAESGIETSEWIGTVNDIDDQRLAEDQLRDLNMQLEQRVAERTVQLEAANKELESFSYSVSHDLRAPVRAIIGFSRILAEDHGKNLDAEGQRQLGIVQSEAQRMGNLIDDLLAFSRLGKKALQKDSLDMTALAQDTFQRLSEEHVSRPVRFQIGALPQASGDRALIEQVWVNLLSNALKFTSKREGPTIEVGAISDETQHIYFVRDNGAGFDPRYQAKLFGVFQRLHDHHEFPGTGVGLALAHRIVTRHGGRVWGEGKKDAGATFYFSLPKEPIDGNL